MIYFITSSIVVDFFTPSSLSFVFVSLWGGLVCYFFNRQFAIFSGMQLTLASQLIASSFLGVLANMLCQCLMWSEQLATMTVGISALIGSNLFHWLWTQLFQPKNI